MDSREFRRLREGLVSNLPPARGAQLDTAAAGLRDRLRSSAMFAEVSVEATDDPERLLVATVRYRPGTPLKQVSSYLEAVWMAELRLPGLDAFHFVTADGHVELAAVTGDAASPGHYITLHLTADESSAEDFAARRPVETEAPVKRRWFRR